MLRRRAVKPGRRGRRCIDVAPANGKRYLIYEFAPTGTPGALVGIVEFPLMTNGKNSNQVA